MLNQLHVQKEAVKEEDDIATEFDTQEEEATAEEDAGQAIITETYKKKGTKNIFTKRDCFLAYSRAYTASAPKVTRSNGVHRASSNGDIVKTFSPWVKGSYLWDVAVRPYGGGSYNTTSVSYKKTTKRVSGFSYTVYCRDTLVPTQAGSVYVVLKTK